MEGLKSRLVANATRHVIKDLGKQSAYAVPPNHTAKHSIFSARTANLQAVGSSAVESNPMTPAF